MVGQPETKVLSLIPMNHLHEKDAAVWYTAASLVL